MFFFPFFFFFLLHEYKHSVLDLYSEYENYMTGRVHTINEKVATVAWQSQSQVF